MHTYYLVDNLLYNCTHIRKKRWYHLILGEPELIIACVEAVDREHAEILFEVKGYKVGLSF